MKFNDQQQEIINAIKGAYLINAPVGTGKTTVLAERVIKALDSGIKPDEILCLTFTNRAAEEMMDRIRSRIKKKDIFDELTIKTFHGFCAYFVRAEAKQLGISPDFVIFDDSEQIEVMRKVLDSYPECAHEYQDNRSIYELLEKLYKYRENQLEREIGCDFNEYEIQEALESINNDYIKELRAQNALDFFELVLTTLRALYLDEKIKSKWSKRYAFIQLDEFQDTHMSEYLVVKQLAREHKNIAFIGDLDQTIYGWRGSEPYKIAGHFKQHFDPVQEYNLEINYRFDKSILGAVKSFLSSFEKPVTKELETENAQGDRECIDVFGAYNFNEEINWVIEGIQKIKSKEPDARIAVLSRTNPLITKIAQQFESKGIAHITVDKYDFFRRQEVKDVYAYLKMVFNTFDLESAYRIVQRPPRNIGPVTIKEIREKGSIIGLKVSDFLNLRNYNYVEPFDHLIKSWTKGRIVVLDTETTGTNPLKDEIIQIYAAEIIDGKIQKEFTHYLKNSIPVGDSYEVHGITDAFLNDKGEDPKDVLEKLKEFIGSDMVIGHNVSFDLSMIIENGKRHGIEFDFKEYYDTWDISKRVIESESYKLTSLAKLLDLKGATHDAKDDVTATIGLLEKLIEELKQQHEQRIAIFKAYSKKFIPLATLINSWKLIVQHERPEKALEYIWEKSGLKEFYTADKDVERRIASFETLKKLFKHKDAADLRPEVVMRELIQYASLVKNLDFLGLDKGKIPVVTVHQVKGLEFDYVFIVGLNEFKFPIYNSDVEEEKRLFYVALTRARKKIFLSYSQHDDYDRAMAKSAFIDYIDSQYINKI